MVELTLPDCEARVSPELLALLREGSWKASAASASARDDTAPPERPVRPVEKALTPSPQARPDLGWSFVSLRRDGARPMRFTGLMVTSHSQSLNVQVDGGSVSVERHLALYLTDAGETVAQVVCVPGEDQPARPVHRAARITGAEEFSALLRVASPDTCFAVSRVAAQWTGPGQDPQGPFHTARSEPHPDNTE